MEHVVKLNVSEADGKCYTADVDTCMIGNASDPHMQYLYIVLICVSAVVTIIAVAVFIYCCKKKICGEKGTETSNNVTSYVEEEEKLQESTELLDSNKFSDSFRREDLKVIHLTRSEDDGKFGFSVIGGGSFEGVYVHEVREGTPAGEADLKKGDQLRWVNEENTKHSSKQDVIAHLTSGANVELKTSNRFKVYQEFLPRIGNSTREADMSSAEDNKPSRPIKKAVNTDSITIEWQAPQSIDTGNIIRYEVRYKINGTSEVDTVWTHDNSEVLEVKKLRTNTEYLFRVRAIVKGEDEDGEEGPFSQYSKPIATEMTLANLIVSDKAYFPKKVLLKDKAIQYWKLPIKIMEGTVDKEMKTRKCVLETEQKHASKPAKTLMIVGATGTGKSTLIDGMINYIFDVRWEDDFRFKLIDLTEIERDKESQQDKSQTEWITCYTIKRLMRSKINYDLNIIDTPGFGDTSGPNKDEQIRLQIERFFKGMAGVNTIDAVCFVVTPQARLTDAQKYIFDKVLGMFGKDIAQNIFMLITFADSAVPPVLKVLEADNIDYQGYFKFNNSALFVSNVKSAEGPESLDWLAHKLNWELGMTNFEKFFDAIEDFVPQSLQMTSEVLETQRNIQATVRGMENHITQLVNDMQTLKDTRILLGKHKQDIEENRNFEGTVSDTIVELVAFSPKWLHRATVCSTCEVTCCYPCQVPKVMEGDFLKSICSAFNFGSNCIVCGHDKSQHSRDHSKYESRVVQRKVTYDDIKRKYDIAKSEESNATAVISNVENRLKSLGKECLVKVKQVKDLLNRLHNQALRPSPLTNEDYLNLLIEKEKVDGKPGWQNRVIMYRKMIKEAKLVHLLVDKSFENIDDLLRDMREDTDPDVPMEM